MHKLNMGIKLLVFNPLAGYLWKIPAPLGCHTSGSGRVMHELGVIRIASWLVVLLVATALSGCGTITPLTASSRSETGAGGVQPAFAQFTDIPVPANAKMDLERSLVLGEREGWTGRIVMSVNENAGRIYDFYFAEMPRFKWEPVTAVRAETSVLTYIHSDRVATIQIHTRTIGGATILMTVSPRGKPAPAPSTMSGEVQISPLK
jgi:uncharacterized protein YceK